MMGGGGAEQAPVSLTREQPEFSISTSECGSAKRGAASVQSLSVHWLGVYRVDFHILNPTNYSIHFLLILLNNNN